MKRPKYPAKDWSQVPGVTIRETLDLSGRACAQTNCPGRLQRASLLPGEFICPVCDTEYRTDGIFIKEPDV